MQRQSLSRAAWARLSLGSGWLAPAPSNLGGMRDIAVTAPNYPRESTSATMPEYSHRGRDRLGHFPLTAMRASPQNRMIVGVTFAAATLGLFFIGVIAGRRRRPRPGNRPIEAELTLGLIPVCASFA